MPHRLNQDERKLYELAKQKVCPHSRLMDGVYVIPHASLTCAGLFDTEGVRLQG